MVQNAKLLLTILILLTSSILNAHARTIGGAASSVTVPPSDWVARLAGALKAVERPLDVATERAEDLYLYNGGHFLSVANNATTHFNLLNNPADAASPEDVNEYLQELAICEKYWVKAKFYEEDAFEGAGDLISSSVPESLNGVKIYLVPVVYIGAIRTPERNYLITTWECITDLKLVKDVKVKRVVSGVEQEVVTQVTKEYPFSGYTTHPFLEKCTYTPHQGEAGAAAGQSWEAITNTMATGDCD